MKRQHPTCNDSILVDAKNNGIENHYQSKAVTKRQSYMLRHDGDLTAEELDEAQLNSLIEDIERAV